MKNLFSITNLGVSRVPNTISAFQNANDELVYIKEYVHLHYSFPIKPTNLNDLLVEIHAIGSNLGQSINLHLFGTGGEYIQNPYHIIYDSQDFNYIANDYDDLKAFNHYPVTIDRVGFSANRKDVLVAVQVKEMEAELNP